MIREVGVEARLRPRGVKRRSCRETPPSMKPAIFRRVTLELAFTTNENGYFQEREGIENGDGGHKGQRCQNGSDGCERGGDVGTGSAGVIQGRDKPLPWITYHPCPQSPSPILVS